MVYLNCPGTSQVGAACGEAATEFGNIFCRSGESDIVHFRQDDSGGRECGTLNPTFMPSKSPSEYPTRKPSIDPSSQPSFIPTTHPTYNPTKDPTVATRENCAVNVQDTSTVDTSSCDANLAAEYWV